MFIQASNGCLIVHDMVRTSAILTSLIIYEVIIPFNLFLKAPHYLWVVIFHYKPSSEQPYQIGVKQ